MKYPWFRMYAEAVDDDKLRLLAFEDRWHFVALLCLKAQGVLDEPSPELRARRIGVKLGLPSLELKAAMDRLSSVGLIDHETWEPINWESRQYQSDSADPTAAERMRRYREKKSSVTVTRNERNVTPIDTDTDTEQEAEGDARGNGRREKPRRPPPAKHAPPDFKPDLAFAREILPDIDADAEAQKFMAWEFKTARSDWPKVWQTWIYRNRDDGRYAKVRAGPPAPPNGYATSDGQPPRWK